MSVIQDDMKNRCLTSLTEGGNRAHYCEFDKFGMKRVDLEENDFTQKGSSEVVMKRITGLDITAGADT